MRFFDAASLPHRVAPDSFYGRMGAVAETLFQVLTSSSCTIQTPAGPVCRRP
jgi:hypothetical protein